MCSSDLGGRLVEGFHSPGPDTETKGSKKTASSRVEGAENEWRKGFDNLQREGREEKRILTSSSELVCFYINARKLNNKMELFEAWVHDINPDVIGVTESWLKVLSHGNYKFRKRIHIK